MFVISRQLITFELVINLNCFCQRWDVQRIREQRQIEKLRQRGRKANGESNDEDELVSLWPSPDQAQFVQIQDAIPVAAFGCPITKFNPV